MTAKRPSYFLMTLLVAFGLVGLSVPRAFGQANATIVGTVTDPSGAVVPGATVTVTDAATGVSQTAMTNSSGFYSVPALETATYNVTIAKSGFKQYVSTNVAVHPGERVTVNATLVIGAATAEVTVSAAAVRVNTASGARGGVITSNEIRDLSLNGRNMMMLSILVPGVVSSTGANSLGGGGIVTGQPLNTNGGTGPVTFLTDGTWNNNTGCMCGPNVTPSLDTIAEFRVMTNNYSAKYPYSGGGIIMSRGKSGTSQFHGGGYDYVRNNKFDSRNFFSPFVAALKQNIFGFTVGGPAYIPGKFNTGEKKMFFFSGVEWRKIRTATTRRGAMATQSMRNGDFSKSPTLPSGGLTLDSSSQAILSKEHPGVSCLSSTTQINPACFDPNSLLYMNTYWPLPNNIPAGFLNYINPGETAINQTEQNYRVDYNFSERYRLMASFRYEDVPDLESSNTWGPDPAPVTRASLGWTGISSILRFSDNINPTTVNQITLVQTADKPRLHGTNFTEPSGLLFNSSTGSGVQLVFPGVDVHGNRFANVNISKGWMSNGTGNLPVDASDGEVTLQDDFTKVKGSHLIQAGALLVFGTKKQNFFSQTNGTFGFSGVHTGDPVADYLLGLDSSFFQTSGEYRNYMYYKDVEEYIQDDWKVNRKLTLNLGLRNVYDGGETKRGNGFSGFDPGRYDPAQAGAVQPNGLFMQSSGGTVLTASGTPANLLDGIVLPADFNAINGLPGGTPGVPRSIYRVPSFLLGPRVGFAYDLFGTGKTAIRGGYGIGWSRIPMGLIYGAVNNPPFVNSVTLLNGTLGNPAFGAPGPKGPTGIDDVGPPNALVHSTQEETWSLGVEQRIVPEGVLDVSYVGAAGHYLDVSRDINFPEPVMSPSISNPACLSPGESATPPGGFNFDPCINKGKVSANYTRGPFPGWAGIGNNGGGAYWGNSNYHSLQVAWRYRVHDFVWTVAYTWSKSMSDTAASQNPRDFKAGYGPTTNNRPQVFTSSYVYTLPFFRGQSGWVGKGLGGWTFSGITDIQSGPSVNPGLATGKSGLAGVANCIGNPRGPHTSYEWFNTAAFVAPAFGYFGNCGAGLIHFPTLSQWNWSLLKSFPVTERAHLELRFEAYNIWNHPSFNGVSTGLGAGNYGHLTSALDPRIMEFALRLDF